MDWTAIAITLAPFIVGTVASLAAAGYKALLQKLPITQREEAARIIQVLVSAAEQGMPGKTGQEKKEAVVSDVESIFKESHINVPPALVNALIEAAVGAMNEGKSAPASEPVGFQPVVSGNVPTVEGLVCREHRPQA